MSTTTPISIGSIPTAVPSIDDLPNDVLTFKRMIAELVATLHQTQSDNQGLRDRIARLLHRIYGSRSERFDPNQLDLFSNLASNQETPTPPPAEPVASESPIKPKKRARQHGRRRMPANLERRPVHHTLTEAERLCQRCGQQRIDIGVDKSEQVDYIPASLIVVEHLVHKYLCPCCSKTPGSMKSKTSEITEQESAASPTSEQPPMTDPKPDPASKPTEPPPPAPPATPSEQPAKTAIPLDSESNAAEQTPSSSSATPLTPIILSATKPTMPIPKGLPGPGLLAHLIVSKYVDHLPLYRLERVYERQGLVLPRSTLCDWLAASGQLLKPLYDLMVSMVLQSRVIHTDDTPVKMQLLPSRQLTTSRLWIYLGDNAHPYNVFDFTLTRRRDGPQLFLVNYKGYLQADAFSGYDGLYLPQGLDGVAPIIEVACNAHARRKFYEARTSDTLRSHQALGWYRSLYELERASKGYAEETLRQIRQDIALPVLEMFRTWLDEQQTQVLPKSPMAEAINYALNQWTALTRYTESGILAIDNNVAEREMKRIAIGRKNWLFFGSEQGGKTASILFSFTSTCQRLGVEPWAYLQDVLTRLPTTSAHQLAGLLPDRWQAARSSPSTNQATPPTSPPTS